VDLEGPVEDDNLIYEGPEEALATVRRELAEPPQCEGAEPRDGCLVGLLSLRDERPLLGLG
jgi:hypothetical protein